MKKLATIVALVCACFICHAQALLYKDGTLQARGFVSSLGNKTITIRVFENNRFASRAFFKASIDSLVILDSLSAAEYATKPGDYPQKTIIRIQRPDFDFKSEYKPEQVAIDLAPRNTISADAIQLRMEKANKHVSNATTSMVGSFAVSLIGSVIVYDMATKASTEGQFRDVGVAAFSFSGVSLGLFINALMQNNKANALLTIK